MFDDEDEDESPEAILAEIEAGPPPPTIEKIGTTKNWMMTIWCDDCNTEHHYFCRHLGKSYDVYELSTKARGKKKKGEEKNGELLYIGRFKDLDRAAEKIEELLEGEEEDDD